MYVGPLIGKSSLKWQWVCKLDILKKHFFITFDYICLYVFTYVLMIRSIIVPYIHLPSLHVWNNAWILLSSLGTLLLHRCSLHAFYWCKAYTRVQWFRHIIILECQQFDSLQIHSIHTISHSQFFITARKSHLARGNISNCLCNNK